MFHNQKFVKLPDISFCDNKWCDTTGNIPTTGVEGIGAKCGNYMSMERERLLNGGLSGRGVTPCPLGYVQRVNSNGITVYLPNTPSDVDFLTTSTIFFDPDRPGYLPPQGNPRPLNRIGNEYKN